MTFSRRSAYFSLRHSALHVDPARNLHPAARQGPWRAFALTRAISCKHRPQGEDCMGASEPRGIAVVDVGATNSKVVLFDSATDASSPSARWRARIARRRPMPISIPSRSVAFLAETLAGARPDPAHRHDRSGGAWRSPRLPRRETASGAAGHGLHGRAAGRDHRRLSQDRAAIFGNLRAAAADGADPRAAALLAGDALSGGFRTGHDHHAVDPVCGLSGSPARGGRDIEHVVPVAAHGCAKRRPIRRWRATAAGTGCFRRWPRPGM